MFEISLGKVNLIFLTSQFAKTCEVIEICTRCTYLTISHWVSIGWISHRAIIFRIFSALRGQLPQYIAYSPPTNSNSHANIFCYASDCLIAKDTRISLSALNLTHDVTLVAESAWEVFPLWRRINYCSGQVSGLKSQIHNEGNSNDIDLTFTNHSYTQAIGGLLIFK